MRRAMWLVLAAALSSAGCSDADRSLPPAATGSPTPEQSADEFVPCTNSEAGYTAEYPAGWETNTGDVMAPCSVFDPEPFELPPASEIPLELAVTILVDDVDYDVVASPRPRTERELDRLETEVDGRTAVRVEVETTETELVPAGTMIYRYVVDLGGRTLIASTNDLGDHDYDEKKEVLDRMVESLEFSARPSPSS